VRLALLCVGKLKEEAERQIVARYLERFRQTGAPLGLAAPEVIELSESRAPAAKERKAAEAAELRKRMAAGACVLALDERGATLASQDFARKLVGWRDEGVRNLAVVIGGPDGLDPDFVASAQAVLSLGRLTLPHGLARAVLAEQLYRAATILAGHPYHRA
jgi:23S rRNA (pseudouridine1915-N3)-methyltransferase